jgi:sugar phosphate isomerase/epimerase
MEPVHMRTPPTLMSLYWTDAGIYPGTAEISPRDFETRVKAAAKAGFRGIGIWHTDLEHILTSRTLREVKAILDDNGMTHLELEFIADWFADGARKRESDTRRRMLLEASAVLGASHVKVGDFYSSKVPMGRLVESWAALCADAKKHGARIGFEFMASAMLTRLEDCLEMVETAGADNGGLIVDIVHVVNLGISHEAVSRIPLNRLVSVELNDGYPPGDPRHDGTGARKLCGEGAFDIAGFIAAIRKTGYSGAWAVEVFAPELVTLPLGEVNRRAFETTMAVFEAAGG